MCHNAPAQILSTPSIIGYRLSTLRLAQQHNMLDRLPAPSQRYNPTGEVEEITHVSGLIGANFVRLMREGREEEDEDEEEDEEEGSESESERERAGESGYESDSEGDDSEDGHTRIRTRTREITRLPPSNSNPESVVTSHLPSVETRLEALRQEHDAQRIRIDSQERAMLHARALATQQTELHSRSAAYAYERYRFALSNSSSSAARRWLGVWEVRRAREEEGTSSVDVVAPGSLLEFPAGVRGQMYLSSLAGHHQQVVPATSEIPTYPTISFSDLSSFNSPDPFAAAFAQERNLVDEELPSPPFSSESQSGNSSRLQSGRFISAGLVRGFASQRQRRDSGDFFDDLQRPSSTRDNEPTPPKTPEEEPGRVYIDNSETNSDADSNVNVQPESEDEGWQTLSDEERRESRAHNLSVRRRRERRRPNPRTRVPQAREPISPSAEWTQVEINTVFQTLSQYAQHQPPQISPSSAWTQAEVNMAFQALSRHSRHSPVAADLEIEDEEDVEVDDEDSEDEASQPTPAVEQYQEDRNETSQPTSSGEQHREDDFDESGGEIFSGEESEEAIFFGPFGGDGCGGI